MNYIYNIFYCFCISLPLLVSAQTHTNSWIDYNDTYYEIPVVHNSLYRISHETLQNYGIPTNSNQLRVFYLGEEVPLYASTTGTMGPTDYVEFYAEKNDGTFDLNLYKNASEQSNPYLNLFTDTAVYYLVSTAFTSDVRYTNMPNNISGSVPPKSEYFMYDSHRNLKNIFHGGVPYRNLGGVNNYFADFGSGEGFVASFIGENDDRDYDVPTPYVYTDASLNAKIQTRVVGRSNDFTAIPDHHLQISVNSSVYVDTTYEGYDNHLYNFLVPVTELGAAETAVNYASLNSINLSTGVDKNSPVYVTITYPRSFNFENATKFKFNLANDSDKYIEIENFDGGDAPVLYDLSNRLRFTPVYEDGVYKFFLPQVSSGAIQRTFFFSNTSEACDYADLPPIFNIDPNACSIMNVATLNPLTFTDYSATENQGNYLILTHQSLRNGDVDEVARYAEYRASAEGGSYSPVIVDIDQLYAQFAYGNAKNPLSIRYFIDYALDTWTTPPEFLLILAKGISYNKFGLNPSQYNACLVPPYGHYPSDISLSTVNDNDYRPRLATGRIPARTPAHIKAYLDKVIEYEAYVPCIPEERLWRKNSVHVAGATSDSEVSDFVGYLNSYQDIYEAPNMGGKVLYTYQKNSDEAVVIPDLANFINDGLAILAFVGHASGQIWNVDIGAASSYTNYGRYPLLIAGSCYVGNMYDSNAIITNMAEEYVLAENVGAIGFLAPVYFGFPSYMNQYLENLYTRMCQEYYNEPIGIVLQKTIEKLYADFPLPGGESTKLTVQEYAFAGDPAVVIGSFDKPEYHITNEQVSFEPATITPNVDSVAVNIVVQNLGMAVSDSFTINVTQTYPDGNSLSVAKRFVSAVYIDTFTVYMPAAADTVNAEGDNAFTVTIDAADEMVEDCEDNNQALVTTFVFSDLLIPIHPCNFAMVCTNDITLKAATGQPLLGGLPYKIEIDTTNSFANPLAQFVLNSESGVIEWNPELDWEDGRVYYWRASQVPTDDGDYNWQQFSFVYLADNCSPGWNQSHYDQYAFNGFADMSINNDTKVFEYASVNNVISVRNAFYAYEEIQVVLNFTNGLLNNSCLKAACQGGISVVAFKPSTELEPMSTFKQNEESGCDGIGSYGNIQCGGGERYGFEFHTGSADQLDALLNFVNNVVPDGYYILLYSVRNHRMGTTEVGEPIIDYMPQLISFFESIGADEMATITPELPFIVFGKKGSEGTYPAEVAINTDPLTTFEMDIDVGGLKNTGKMKSVIIGPSKAWESMYTSYSSLETPDFDQDLAMFNIYGINANSGSDTLLYNNIDVTTFSLNAIDANEYPYLRIEEVAIDTSSFTPTQLNYWRIHHQMAGELSLDKAAQFTFYADTLQEGENIDLTYAITNVTGVDFDSLLVSYTIIDANNVAHELDIPRMQPVKANSTEIASFSYSTQNFVGHNILLVEINPDNDQLEKFRFNNVMLLTFFVEEDRINPVLDVTFDGLHILDGDIVSATPNIVVQANDENPYLPLNNINDFELLLRYPDATGEPTLEQVLDLNADWVTFTPATSNDAADGANKASLTLNPQFTESGLYELVVNARDRTQNTFAGANAYTSRFRVETQPAISNMLTYPNPFTTSTQFVFTLTGTEVPQNLKIQIMTVSGKVVREITLTELGNVHIGNNITDYAWDGTDTFGNKLANGVYLYKVSASLNGETLDHYDNNTDPYFKKGIGKMYLMR